MAVVRVGQPQEGQTHVRSLGRVRVCIDDLAALIALLNAESGHVARIAFDGGHFDEPADLRSLSDGELRRLVVQSDNTDVVLGPREARAIGRRPDVEAVYRLWARSRQTHMRPQSTRWRERVTDELFGAFLGSLIGGLLVAYIIMTTGVVSEMFPNASSPIIASLGLGVVFVIAFLNTFLYSKTPLWQASYAVIVPFTQDELRKNMVANRYPRLSYFVAIASLIVATVAVTVSILRK